MNVTENASFINVEGMKDAYVIINKNPQHLLIFTQKIVFQLRENVKRNFSKFLKVIRYL